MDQLTASQITQLHPLRRIAERPDAGSWLMAGPTGQRYVRKTMATPLLAVRARGLFQQRLRVLTALRHPHLAQVTAGWVQRTECAILTDYAPRGSLHDAVAAHNARLWTLPMPPLEATRLIVEIAAGVQTLHNHGMIHGGLKLTNVLLFAGYDGQWHAKITDVVLHEGFINGTLRNAADRPTNLTDPWRYLAPEQYQQRPDFASDQFALGMIAYLLLTGEAPYTIDPIAYLQVRDVPLLRPASALNAVLPRAVDLVLVRALQRAPRARYPAVQTFAEELQTAIGLQRPSHAIQVSPSSIPRALGRDAQASSIVQPHEVMRPPVPLALHNEAASLSVPVPGLPDLPPHYRWADEVVSTHSQKLSVVPAPIPPTVRRRRTIPVALLAAVTVLLMAMLVAFAVLLMGH